MADHTDGLATNGLGFLACGLVLCTFAMTSMRWLRVVAMASNVCFVAYAWLMGLWPILLLHALLLPLNAVRLCQIEAERRRPGGSGRRPPGVPRPIADEGIASPPAVYVAAGPEPAIGGVSRRASSDAVFPRLGGARACGRAEGW